jgi:hypothetical protein
MTGLLSRALATASISRATLHTPEAAEMLDIGEDALLDLVVQGEIPSLRISPRITASPSRRSFGGGRAGGLVGDACRSLPHAAASTSAATRRPVPELAFRGGQAPLGALPGSP